jgi:hypothetical protein
VLVLQAVGCADAVRAPFQGPELHIEQHSFLNLPAAFLYVASRAAVDMFSHDVSTTLLGCPKLEWTAWPRRYGEGLSSCAPVC